MTMELPVNDIPPEIKDLHKSWHFYFRSWWFFHYLIGIVGVVAAITVANNPAFLQPYPIQFNGIAWLSAVCVSLLTFLEPKKRARAYAAAWRTLHEQIGLYRYGEDADPAKLFKAAKEAEEIIARLDS